MAQHPDEINQRTVRIERNCLNSADLYHFSTLYRYVLRKNRVRLIVTTPGFRVKKNEMIPYNMGFRAVTITSISSRSRGRLHQLRAVPPQIFSTLNPAILNSNTSSG